MLAWGLIPRGGPGAGRCGLHNTWEPGPEWKLRLSEGRSVADSLDPPHSSAASVPPPGQFATFRAQNVDKVSQPVKLVFPRSVVAPQ